MTLAGQLADLEDRLWLIASRNAEDVRVASMPGGMIDFPVAAGALLTFFATLAIQSGDYRTRVVPDCSLRRAARACVR